MSQSGECNWWLSQGFDFPHWLEMQQIQTISQTTSPKTWKHSNFIEMWDHEVEPTQTLRKSSHCSIHRRNHLRTKWQSSQIGLRQPPYHIYPSLILRSLWHIPLWSRTFKLFFIGHCVPPGSQSFIKPLVTRITNLLSTICLGSGLSSGCFQLPTLGCQ